MEQQFPHVPVLLTFSLFIFMLMRTWKKYSKTSYSTPNLPPGPWKLPIIGNIHQLVGFLPHHRLRDLAKNYGPVMHLQIGQVPTVVISSPETAKLVMKTYDLNFVERPALLAPTIMFYNRKDIVFAPYGDYWRQLRKICTLELLSTKRVQSFRSIREEEVSNLIRSISSNAGFSINLSKMVSSLTNDIFARSAFGKKCKNQETFVSTVRESLDEGGGFGVADLFPSFKWIHLISGMRSRIERIQEEADKILENIINERRASKAVTKTGENEVDDLLEVLLNLQDHGNLEIPLTTENIKAIILDLVAGSDTPSIVIEWAMSEMVKNPRVMEKAREEVRQVFNEKGKVDETGLHELKFLKIIIKETMRLHPPGVLITRECREKCEINGYDIDAKTKLLVNTWAIGRDPNYWTEGEQFYPERFLNCPTDYTGNNFGLIPFGAGRRMCPGILFGMANVELVLAQLLYHFDWKLPCGEKPENLDMTEMFSASTRRNKDLNLIPIPFCPLPVG